MGAELQMRGKTERLATAKLWWSGNSWKGGGIQGGGVGKKAHSLPKKLEKLPKRGEFRKRTTPKGETKVGKITQKTSAIKKDRTRKEFLQDYTGKRGKKKQENTCRANKMVWNNNP